MVDACRPKGGNKHKAFSVSMNSELESTLPASAELWRHQAEQRWFCIRTHLKHEHIATAHLRQIVGVEVFNPQLRLLRSTRQGCRWRTESLFPNYVFACFPLESLLERVTYTPGVKVVLRFGNRVSEVPDATIEEMRQGLAELSSKVLTDTPPEGEEVELIGGAFAGMKAAVTRVLPGKQRAQILLEVMGQLVPAELSLDLVLFNRKEAAQIALARIEPGFTRKAMLAVSS